MRFRGRNFYQFTSKANIPFCNALDKFVGKSNLIIFTPVFRAGGGGLKMLAFGALRSYFR